MPLYPYMEGERLARPDSPASADCPCKAPRSFLSPAIENVKSVDLLRSRKVAYPWTGETHFKVALDACGKSILRASARNLAQDIGSSQ